MTLKQHRAEAEQAIERADRGLQNPILAPYHADYARRRQDAAKAAAHFDSLIQKEEAHYDTQIDVPRAAQGRNLAGRLCRLCAVALANRG